MRVFGGMFALFGVVFMCVGIGMAWHQHRRISVSMPMQAEVLSARVDVQRSSSSNGGSSTTYKPVVEFRYNVDGVEFRNDDVLPMSMSAGRAWAHKVIAPFTVGTTVEGFYDPGKPQRSFLLKRYSFFPYVFILFPMLFVAIGIGVGVGGGASARKPPAPVASADGWYEVQPRRSLGQRCRAAWAATLLWDGAGCFACGHYFLVAGPDYELMAFVVSGIYFALGLGVAGFAVYSTILSQNIRDARLYVQAAAVRMGEEVVIGARQQIMKSIQVTEARMGVVCKETTRTRSGGKTRYSTNTCYEQMKTVMTDHRGQAGEQLSYACRLTIPAGQPASTPAASKAYPRHTWLIRLRVKLAGSPDYQSDFPVTVHGSPTGQDLGGHAANPLDDAG